jgi:fructose-1,6-bisphosphatase
VLTEGPFDMLSLYLYSDEFKDCFFISLNGKKYSSALEWLILEYFLIDHLEVNFVFDNDVTKYRTYLFRAKALAKNYNENVIIRGWKPMIGKDTGDFPGVVEL